MNYIFALAGLYVIVMDIIEWRRLNQLEKRVQVLEKKTEDITVAE